MLSVVVPLYAVAVGLSAAEIGFIVAARSVLPTALSIHGGIVMDYWGTRRVVLWLGAACAVLPPLYPASGWFEPLIVLQLLLGLASSLGMAASQTWSLQTSYDTASLARFSLVSRIGTFLGPLMIGAVWDFLGAWAAFACISLWAGGTVVATLGAHERPNENAHRETADGKRRPLAVLVPDWRAHKQALALALIPAVGFVLAVSFLRNAPGAIQSSLYIVYLGDLGVSGTMIGALVSFSELLGIGGTMIAAPLERFARPQTLVVSGIAVSIVAITLTPLVAFSLALLFVTAGLRGASQGMSQPLMYSLLGRSVPAGAHGTSVGLRSAVTRLASIITPATMGVAAEIWGVEASFYVAGALLLLATAALAMAARRLRHTT